ncbi:hypothetical protein NX862_04695 [Rhodobacter sp. KR11]|uniref:hypothetical protein n=1 Tax=Rhodobacter sp. KR11 TaxID=2974588 RepID=UPI00222131D9|nr:hypothetical protein [Rhodobacter sp. KR11]MCW1918043.1 hypothetical protein [Rhodobacter sp. KR11]
MTLHLSAESPLGQHVLAAVDQALKSGDRLPNHTPLMLMAFAAFAQLAPWLIELSLSW